MTSEDLSNQFPPLSSTVQVEFGAQSRRGRNRPVNEDHYAIIELGRHQETLFTSLPPSSLAKRFDEFGYGMMVADGVGDTGVGETASRLALATLVELVRHFGKWNLRVDDLIAREILARAERFYRHVDATVAYEGAVGPAVGLQTTLTSVFSAGRDLFFAHVGHSRAFLFRKRELMRLTRDHTVGSQGRSVLRPAPLVDVNAAARDLKHILTETIGMGGLTGPTIDLERFQIDDQDVVVVCTNGLTDAVPEDVIAEVLASGAPPERLCVELADLAETNTEDDITVLIGRYHLSFPTPE
jgi:protein phosphatase